MRLISTRKRMGVLGVASSAVSLAVFTESMLSPAGMVAFLLVLVFILSFYIPIQLWQRMSMAMLIGFTVLNYGFANWSIRLFTIPLPVGHLLSFLALGLIPWKLKYITEFGRVPIHLCWLFLLVMTFFHLFWDASQYGIYAFRDASFVFEGVFLVLGALWAKTQKDSNRLIKLLFLLFVLNFLYSLTFSWGEWIRTHSPVSGIFLQIPLLGFYSSNSLFLVLGGLFCLLDVFKPADRYRPLLYFFGVVQIGWSFIFQERSMYLGIMISLLLISLFRGAKKGLKIISYLLSGFFFQFLIVYLFDIKIPGRVGDMDPGFFFQHLKSILLIPGTPAEETARWRVDLLSQVWDHWTFNLTTIFVGEGFGNPIIDFHISETIAVRQPHNTHLSVLVRLGIIGFAFWVLLNGLILKRFLKKMRELRRGSYEQRVVLWFFLFYVLGFLLTTVQPWLEFSYGAIPFFFLIGFILSRMDQPIVPESSIQTPGKIHRANRNPPISKAIDKPEGIICPTNVPFSRQELVASNTWSTPHADISQSRKARRIET